MQIHIKNMLLSISKQYIITLKQQLKILITKPCDQNQHTLIGEAMLFFDKGLRRSIEDMVVCSGPFFDDFQWRLAFLPIRFGGLGLYSAYEDSSCTFVASRA